MTTDISSASTMEEVLKCYPGAQRTLFKRYHIGGCSSCAFQAGETLEQICSRNNHLDPAEVLAHLKSSHEEDEQMQLAPPDLHLLLKGPTPPKLLDVRTHEEWDAVRIEGAVRMSQETMQEILGKWPREELVVIIDHHGAQGLDAAAYFHGQGFKNIRCLRGGIDAWSQEVDPSLPRYTLDRS